MVKNQKGFTLIELIVIIVIIGILAAIAIPSYINLTQQAADGTAKGVLGALRAATNLMYAQNVVGGTTAAFDVASVVGAVTLQGIQTSATNATNGTFQFYVGAYPYTFYLNPTQGTAPTTLPTVTAGAGTYTTW